MFQTIVGSSQPIVVFAQQPQQQYISVPQVDPMMTSSIPGEWIHINCESNR